MTARRTVTVLFADIVGSTSLGEQLDPEVVRNVLGRQFATARGVIERHGGTVEKFIGDAVMAVFGIPKAHEDDAMRALRAAIELRDGLRGDAGALVAFRIGVNTGEVVSGEGAGETLVTGDAVNTAARLEQAAAPGEVIIGERTFELARDAIRAEPMPPLDLKGKLAPTRAYRLLELVAEEGRRRRLEGSIVGRQREVARLLEAWDAAAQQPRLVTILAPAGVGKSRLLRELGARIGNGARILRGRCLPYGDGITYWPIRELVHALADIGEADDQATALAKLHAAIAEGEPPEVARSVAAAIGLETEAVKQEEIFWAVRRMLEGVVRRGRLAVFVEDLHWAEATLLDLLEYVLEMATTPMLLVATARPELLSEQPGWGSGAGAEILRLEALAGDDAHGLLLAQPGGAALPDEVRTRILDAAEGNALFLEEMIGMLRDRGALVVEDGAWRMSDATTDVEVPPNVQALLAARLDELPREERAVAEHASVIGRSFEAAAVGELVPADLRTDLARRLLALVRKELLRPDRSMLTEGDAFRFRHILIRDAAYAALPKAERAALHERFATWLEGATDRIGEFEEVVGYHLAQAVTYRRELGMVGADTDALSQRAAESLRAAGRRARLRFDHAATEALLARATELATVQDVELGRDLLSLRNAQVALGQLDAARRSVERLDQLVGVVDDVEMRLRRDIVVHLVQPVEGRPASLDRRADGERILGEATEAGLPGVQASALIQLGVAELLEGRPMEEFRYLERAEAVALLDPDPMVVRTVRFYMANRLPPLPMPIDEIERRLSDQLEVAADVSVRSELRLGLAYVAAVTNRPEDARSLAARARREADEVGLRGFFFDSWASTAAEIEVLCGAPDRGEALLREAYPELIRLNDWWMVAQYAPQMARMIAIQPDRLTDDRADEAIELVRFGRASPEEQEAMLTAVGDEALALVDSWRGDHSEAVRLAEAAVDVATRPGASPDHAAYALVVLARVLAAAGRTPDARETAARAADVAATKGLRVWQRMAQDVLAT
jgi:class 3 adenylate cyclase